MDSDRLAKLSEGQRRCLRLVLAHKSSKDIARELGISSHTVDQRLKSAMRLLAASSRVEAAQIHAGLEGGYQPLVYQTPDIAAGTPLGRFGAPAEELEAIGATVREDRAVYQAFQQAPAKRSLLSSLPIGEGKPNDLTALQRLGWIFGILLLIALTFGIFIAGLEALSRLGIANR